MEHLTPTELRRTLKISDTHYWTLIKQGMPCVRIGKRSRRFDLEKVLAWLNQRGEGDES